MGPLELSHSNVTSIVATRKCRRTCPNRYATKTSTSLRVHLGMNEYMVRATALQILDGVGGDGDCIIAKDSRKHLCSVSVRELV